MITNAKIDQSEETEWVVGAISPEFQCYLSPEIWGKVFTDRFKCSDGYIFSIWYKLIHFSLPLNPAIHRIGNSPTTLCPRCKESDKTHPQFIFQCKLSQTTLNFINELINRNCTFQSPFIFKMHQRHSNGKFFPFPRWHEIRNSSNTYWSFHKAPFFLPKESFLWGWI